MYRHQERVVLAVELDDGPQRRVDNPWVAEPLDVVATDAIESVEPPGLGRSTLGRVRGIPLRSAISIAASPVAASVVAGRRTIVYPSLAGASPNRSARQRGGSSGRIQGRPRDRAHRASEW
jgi:hypothetical protein